MSTTDVHPTTTPRDTGLHRLSFGLWIALAGAVLGISAIASDFYFLQESETVRDAWFGVPHTADLILASALVAIATAALTASDRGPFGGRAMGGLVAFVGLLATAQLVYRMIVPPFGGCLTYNCGGTPNQSVDLLFGIWMALAGTVAVTLGGIIHAFTGKARDARPNFWTARAQPGITPWLGLASLASAVMAAVTFWPWYTANFSGEGGPKTWSGWIAVPHTSSFLVVIAAAVVFLTVAAARNRSPMNPSALGATIALLGFAGVARIAYRLWVPPFHSSAVEGTFDTGSVAIHLWAWLSIAAAAVVLIAGIAQAATHREAERAATRPRGDLGGSTS